jgi:hypothetical protein
MLLVSIELRPLTSPLHVPGCQMHHCRMKIDSWKIYVPEKSLYHYHFVYHKFHMECRGSDSGTRMGVSLGITVLLYVQYVTGYYCTVLLTICI